MRARVALAAALLIVAPPATAQTLSGSWRVAAMSAGPAIPVDAEAIFEFRNGRVSGRAFCNRFMAAFEREGPELSIKSAATTRMTCPEPLMALERAFLDILGRAASATIDAAGTLTIRASDGRTIAARRS